MKTLKIAVIAEDKTDCDTLRVIIQRILGKETAVKGVAARGCGNLAKMIPSALRDLEKQSYSIFIIVRDLDDQDEVKIRRKLEEIVRSSSRHPEKCLICIPIQELEAWFWADQAVLAIATAKRTIKAHLNPQSLKNPKEKLIEASTEGNRKPRYITQKNPDLAEQLDLKICADRCPSFRDLQDFLVAL